jgi:hypothetical protein
LHQPGGIEKFTPADGQTVKDVFVKHMSELLNSGFAIRVMPPVANDLEDLVQVRNMLGIKALGDGMEP